MPGLSAILEATRDRVRALAPRRGALETAAAAAPAPPPWTAAFQTESVGVIAEVKRRSPSSGDIAPGLDPARLARDYVRGGAVAVSVLTDEAYFGGSLDDLRAVRAAVAAPVLRKDFLIDPVQLYESRAVGASAVLLIVRALDAGALRELSVLAKDLGLARLVEAHSAAEVEQAASLAPEAIGVNSRDLETFHVALDPLRALLAAIPDGVIAVAESGIDSRAAVSRVASWGADAVLVGTAVARSTEPATAVRALAGVRRRGRVGAHVEESIG